MCRTVRQGEREAMTTNPSFDTIGTRIGTRIGAFVDDVVNPQRPRGGSPRRLLRVRQVAAVGGALATLVQIVIWLMIAVISGDLDSPWWLTTAVPVAILVGILTAADRVSGDPMSGEQR